MKMPTFMAEMKSMLPKDILKKHGNRVFDNSLGSLCELLRKHVTLVEEINDLRAIVKEIHESDNPENFGGL